MGILKIKRIYDQPTADDGIRIFVDRLWARGISKERAHLDYWLKDIAPSSDLRKWFNHKPERFKEFSKYYKKELDSEPEEIDKPRRCFKRIYYTKKQTVEKSTVCFCKNRRLSCSLAFNGNSAFCFMRVTAQQQKRSSC